MLKPNKPKDVYGHNPDEIIVVHLGNLGYGGKYNPIREEPLAAKTGRYARRFEKRFENNCYRSISNIHFYGIDKEPYLYENGFFTQITEEFLDGLEQFVDGSVSIVSSDIAVGHYCSHSFKVSSNRVDYCTRLFDLVYKKLKKGGKLFISAGEDETSDLFSALEKSEFKNPEKRSFRKEEYERTYWTRWHRQFLKDLFQITASKD